MAEMKHADRFARVAARLRARGFEVDEQSGWRSRGSRGRSLVAVEGVMMHHTVDNPPSDYPSLRVVRDGRSDLPGPLAQFGVGRSGRILLIAAGLANHAGRTAHAWQQNSRCVGIESAHMGTSKERWTDASTAAQRALVEELGREFGFGRDRVTGHKEAAVPRGRKVDPNYDMDAFRRSLKFSAPIPAVPLPVQNEEDELDANQAAALARVDTNSAANHELLKVIRQRLEVNLAGTAAIGRTVEATRQNIGDAARQDAARVAALPAELRKEWARTLLPIVQDALVEGGSK